MKSINPEIVERIRALKTQGVSLKKIAKQFHISKSTVATLCRDLYRSKTRVYKTEKAVRERIRHRTYATSPCPDCGSPIRTDHATCRPCYIKRLKVRGYKRQAVKQQIDTPEKQRRVDIVLEEAVRKQTVVPSVWKKPLTLNVCPDNPNIRAHHYILDRQNRGVCKYCGLAKEFRPHYNEPFSYNNDLTVREEKLKVVAEKY